MSVSDIRELRAQGQSAAFLHKGAAGIGRVSHLAWMLYIVSKTVMIVGTPHVLA